MTVRQWLGRARGIDREIDMLLKAKRETREKLMRVTQNYSKDGAQASKDPHKYDRLAEMENMIDQKVDELIAAKKEIAEAITLLEDWRHRQVLFSYYVRCRSLEQIAVEQHYSYKQVKRFHKAGIEEFERCPPMSPENVL